jgi:phosphopantetheinyl transferase
MNVKIFSLNNVEIALIKVDEWKEFFPQKNTPEIIENQKRIIEKEGVKYLLQKYLPFDNLDYNPNGKPILASGGYISISHSRSLIGIAWSFEYNIGLDIEEINERILKVESRFIHDEEKLFSKTLKDKISIWGIKEALIKIYDNKSFNLMNDLRVRKVSLNKWNGFSPKLTSHTIDFCTFEFHNNIICINTSGEQ